MVRLNYGMKIPTLLSFDSTVFSSVCTLTKPREYTATDWGYAIHVVLGHTKPIRFRQTKYQKGMADLGRIRRK